LGLALVPRALSARPSIGAIARHEAAAELATDYELINADLLDDKSLRFPGAGVRRVSTSRIAIPRDPGRAPLGSDQGVDDRIRVAPKLGLLYARQAIRSTDFDGSSRKGDNLFAADVCQTCAPAASKPRCPAAMFGACLTVLQMVSNHQSSLPAPRRRR
jgi:hypothetical protein